MDITLLLTAMKNLFLCLLVTTVLSCTRRETEVDPGKEDTVMDEYPDWYVLKSPVDHAIMGVWGNYDKTVVISTGTEMFRTTDRGKSWQKVYEGTTTQFGIVSFQDTLFSMNGLVTQGKENVFHQVLLTAENYSVNDGQSWQRYRGTNSVLYTIPAYEAKDKFFVNPIPATGDDTYEINKVYLNEPGALTGEFTTPGVITSTGWRIDLPQLHQIQSLYMDDQQRLYVVGSDATCKSQETFMFCNSRGGRGVVYVSKRRLP